ncbi:MAG: hypothetical protein WCK58_07560 [Chloroflexota bacterium]
MEGRTTTGRPDERRAERRVGQSLPGDARSRADAPGGRSRFASGRDTTDAGDEAAARIRRDTLREMGVIPIEPDARIAVLLAADEQVVTVRREVTLERRLAWQGRGAGLRGDLYVTTRRLVHLGDVAVEYGLADVHEAVIAPGALRLIVGRSQGVEICTVDPRVLRVEIGAVRLAAGDQAAGQAPADAGPGHPAGT